MISMDYDLIVVGGGPGGASCGRKAAQLGLSVLVIDKDKHPRRKACGGGLTGKVSEALDFDISSVVERKIYGGRIYSPSGLVIEHTLDDSAGGNVRREAFDNLLLRKAEEAGSKVIEGERVVDIQEKSDSVTAITESGTYAGRLLVGADGVNSLVAKKTGLRMKWKDDQVGLCIEASVPMTKEEVDRISTATANPEHSVAEIYFGKVNYGYAWAFPKENEISLGIGVRISKMEDLKGAWKDFIAEFEERHGVKCDLSDTTAARVPLKPKIENTHTKRVMLAGDAAGMVAPVTAEGIYFAIESGKLAGEIAHAVLNEGEKISTYEKQLKKKFAGELKAAESLYNMMMKSTKTMEMAVQLSATDDVLRGYTLELSGGVVPYKESQRRIMKRIITKHPGKGIKMLFA